MKALACLGGGPLFPFRYELAPPSLPAIEKLNPRLRDAFANSWLTNFGRYVREFEEKLADLFQVGAVATVCNATLGLIIALDIAGSGGEVILPSYSFPATGQAVLWTRSRLVFADVEPNNLTLSADSAESVLSSDVRAIVPVHSFGMAADMEKLCSVAETADIPLICDSAQALGTIFKGRSLLQWGDINVVSFHATKILAIGEGGAIVANDPVIVEEARRRSNFGFELRGGKGIVKTLGLNAKLAEMPAILGLAQLDRLDEMLEKRQNWVETYRQSLAGVPGLEFVEPREGCVPNNQVCTLKLTPEKFGMSPEVLVWALMQENVVCRVYFCPPMHRQPSFLQQGYRQPHDGLPVTDQVCKTTISLPMQPDRQLHDAKIIAESVIRHHEKASEVNEAFFSSEEEA